MTDEEKKEFEEFLKWKAQKAQKESATTETAKEPIKVDVDAKVNASITPSVNINWYQKLTDRQKALMMVYIIWFIVHVLFLVSGRGRNHFFPWIHKARGTIDYAFARQHGWAPVPPEQWKIDWDIDYYGLPEFIVYVILVPVVVFFIYTLYNNMKSTPSQPNE